MSSTGLRKGPRAKQGWMQQAAASLPSMPASLSLSSPSSSCLGAAVSASLSLQSLALMCCLYNL